MPHLADCNQLGQRAHNGYIEHGPVNGIPSVSYNYDNKKQQYLS